MNTSQLEKMVIETLTEFKAQDLCVLDVRNLTHITDLMIICTGTSSRQTQSIADELVKRAKQQQHQPLGVEGDDKCEWILVDLNDVIVHVMLAHTREFYALEKLWSHPVG